MGSITGAVLGAIVITILPELLRQLPSVGGFNFADLRLVIYAALLIIIMLTRPQGVLGEREIGLHWLRRAQKAPEGDRQVGDDKGVPIAQHADEAEEVEKR
jgi:branched-chain amino acid transport system permease protein